MAAALNRRPSEPGFGRLTRPLVGVTRVFVDTARGLGLDLVSAAARTGEVVTRTAAGTPERGPATVRLNVLILSDENGVPLTTPDRIAPSIELADRVFTDHARIRVRCSAVETVSQPAPTTALDPHADRGLLRDEILGRTAFYRDHLARRAAWSVVGDPVTVIVVREISGRATGCSLGMTTDWVVVQASLFDHADRGTHDRTVLAHELGHAMNLPHHRHPANLMSGISSPPNAVRGTALARWQAAVLQANRHAIPPAGTEPASG